MDASALQLIIPVAGIAAVIAGLGPASYDLGLRAAADLLARRG